MFGQENQRSAMSAFISGVQTLTTGDRDQHADTGTICAWRRARCLERALGLEDQPAGAEQPVAEHQRDAGEQRERREEVERAAGEMPAFDLEALDESAEHHALREGGDGRAVAEAVLPERAMLRVAEAELERDAAEDQRQQHDQDREIDRGDDDGEGEREGRQQSDAAQNQPGLVAVPHRRDRIHRRCCASPCRAGSR